jgi:predicted RNA-binding Zn ribbon-like protein
MVNDDPAARQEAPGELEAVRELLNTWLIPNDTRQATDRFDTYATAHQLGARQARQLRRLRDDLRAVVERCDDADERLNSWSAALEVRIDIRDARLRFGHASGPTGEMFGRVLAAVADGTWPRLKACPDCRWVFYDHTRNRSKRWCLMNAGGPSGRSCGTIAKVTRYRRAHASK